VIPENEDLCQFGGWRDAKTVRKSRGLRLTDNHLEYGSIPILDTDGLKQRQEQILGDWLTRYRRLIYRVIVLYARDAASGDDLYQEIALALWRSIPNFESRSSESTWIYRVALNTALSAARRAPRIDDDGTAGLERIAGPDGELTREQESELSWVYDRIRTMNLIDRSLVLLYLDGNSYQDIAEILGISESNVGVKINRVKARLRALVETEAI